MPTYDPNMRVRPSAFQEGLAEAINMLGGRIMATPAEKQQALVERQHAMQEQLGNQPASSAGQAMARLIFIRALQAIGRTPQQIEEELPAMMANLTRRDIEDLTKAAPLARDPRPEPRPYGLMAQSPEQIRKEAFEFAERSAPARARMFMGVGASDPVPMEVLKGVRAGVYIAQVSQLGAMNPSPKLTEAYQKLRTLASSNPKAVAKAAAGSITPRGVELLRQEYGVDYDKMYDLFSALNHKAFQKRPFGFFDATEVYMP